MLQLASGDDTQEVSKHAEIDVTGRGLRALAAAVTPARAAAHLTPPRYMPPCHGTHHPTTVTPAHGHRTYLHATLHITPWR